MRLQGHAALITGAAKGIGKAAALRFAREGAKVAIADIDPAGEAVAQEIRAAAGEATFIACDATDPASAEQAVAQAVAAMGDLSILYNNAGGTQPGDGSVIDTDLDRFWNTLKLDLGGTWNFSRSALPVLIARGGGVVLNTSSMLAFGGQQSNRTPHAYTASKGAIASLTRAMALEHAPQNIRVNAIAPGVTLTERILKRFEGRAPNPAFENRVLLGKMEPEDVVNTALFLVSDEAAHMTGQVVLIDSGVSVS